MSSYGASLNCDELHAEKIYWKNFVPPIAGGGGGDSLATVLSNGNDGNGDNITNLNKIELATVEASSQVKTSYLDTITAEIGQCDVSVNADGLRDNGTKSTITNFDLTSATNVFPPALREDIEAVLIEGSNANSQSITGLLDINSTNSTFNTSAIGTINTDLIEPLTTNPGITAEIGKTNPFSAITSETLTANAKLEARAAENGAHLPTTIFYSTEPTPTINGDITNGLLRCKSVHVDNQYDSASPAVVLSELGADSLGVVASSGLVQSQVVMTTPNFNAINKADSTPAQFNIVSGGLFKGSTTGVPLTGQCVFTDCDFRSSTNLFNSSAAEQYEWGCHATPTTTRSVVSNDQGKVDFGPDLYALTPATTITAHRSQIINLEFNITQYSWDTIFIGLDISNADGTIKTQLAERCFLSQFEPKGIQTTSRQKIGICSLNFYVQSDLFVDGNQHRIYPFVRTNLDAAGEIRIHFGPNMSTYSPADNQLLVGQMTIQGRPAPNTWRFID